MSDHPVPDRLHPGGWAPLDVPPHTDPGTPYGVQPYWPAGGVRFIPGPMPDGPREYQQMLRGPRVRWWRALVAASILLAIALLAQIVAIVPVIVAGVLTGVGDLGAWLSRELNRLAAGGPIGPAGFLYVNLGLMALIPAAGLSNWAAHHIRPRFLSSVVGGLRWRWLARCVLLLAPLWGLYYAVVGLSGPPASPRPDQWLVLLAMAVFLTPLQAAGEEYAFRGWILQNVGSWIRHPSVAVVVGTLLSTATFSAAHMSPDPWVLGTFAVFSVSACIATWRTGGLEAAIVMHVVHNVGGLGLALTRGGWDEAFASGETKSTPIAFLLSLLLQAVALTLILWQAKRARISRLYIPPPPVRWQPPVGMGPAVSLEVAPTSQPYGAAPPPPRAE